jgi:hypothetical protein
MSKVCAHAHVCPCMPLHAHISAHTQSHSQAKYQNNCEYILRWADSSAVVKLANQAFSIFVNHLIIQMAWPLKKYHGQKYIL